MAPFNLCSCCEERTRKVIRDRATRKNIYVCPACFKAKKHLKNANPSSVQQEDKAQKKVDNNGQNDVPEQPLDNPQNEENQVQIELDKPLEHQDEVNEAQKEENKSSEKVHEEILQNDVVEELPTTSTAANANVHPIITPPLMEIVIMNNRKYIAISVTADAE